MMKKLLYVLLVIEITLTVAAFFMLLPASLFAAIFLSGLNALSLVPIIAIIHNINTIDDLEYDLSKLRYKVKELYDIVNKDAPEGERASEVYKGRAMGNWKCVKCGTVNKEGSSRCESCQAAYTPEYNPTDDPNKRKKVSRWIKYK
ncbi:MAG: hypothetical protein IJ946_09035 [Clostridia bacterium]|nr:hypothetical protein [Clostridia bacterium]